MDDGTEKDQPKESTVSKLKNRFPKPRKKRLLAVLFLLVIAGAGVFAFVVRDNDRPLTACSDESEGSLSHQASEVLYPNNIEESAHLKSIYNQVKSIDNYEEDPNCLIPVVTYYIDDLDPDQARAYHSRLEAVYKREHTTRFYQENNITPSSIKREIVKLDDFIEDADNNRLFIGEVETDE